MKLPAGIQKVTIVQRDDYWIFPPIGFLEIEEANIFIASIAAQREVA